MPRSAFLFALCAAVLPLAAQPPRANQDESKVGSYTLPDPLRLENGQPVRDAETWRSRRRLEIQALFESQVYGRPAPPPENIVYEVVSRDAAALGRKATRKEIDIWLTGGKTGRKMRLLVYLPNARKPAPVFLGMNFGGNHTIHSDPGISETASWVRAKRERGAAASRWPLDLILGRGYAVATIYYGDVFPDRADGLADSIIPKLYRPGQTSQGPEDWNAIGAWAWALSRAFDYIQKDRDLDARHVAVIGHSRLGKTALWAGARDTRFAMVISNDSGEGGAALARRNFGETVKAINTAFPHWFCGNYKQYNDDPSKLPVDQHLLIAMVAPRPVYVASADQDLWADPKGERLALEAAKPVYDLLGAGGRMAYHLRPGKHDITAYDWERYLDFADRQWK